MDQVAEIKQKLDIVDVVGGYVSLKKSGRNYRGLCPFHAENTPSFMVSSELQIFKCFGCNEAGDIYTFIQKIEGVEFPQALEKLADRAGIVLERRSVDPNESKKKLLYELNHMTSEFYHFLLTKHKVGKPGLTYLKDQRKLSNETIKEFRLGYAPKTWDLLFKFLTKKGYKINDIVLAGLIVLKRSGGYIDKFRGRIIFPLTGIDGKIVGFAGRTIFNEDPKYLNTSETPVFHKGAFIYGLDQAKVSIKKGGAIFVEGYIDVLSAHQHNFKNVVAVSGTSLTIDQLKSISHYTKDIIFCFDSDSAGDQAMHRAIDMAESMDFNLKALLIPKEYKDLDELLTKETKNAQRIVNETIPIYDFFLVSALKKHDKTQVIGKKLIVQELVPVFSKIKNPVTLDHYVNKVSKELGIKEEVVSSLFKNPQTVEDELENLVVQTAKKSSQEYMIALLIKAPIDTLRPVLYKLGQEDFTDDNLKKVFSELKDYLTNLRGSFHIKKFVPNLDDNTRKLVEDLYLWDLEYILSEPRILISEIDKTFDRVKRERVKRELRELGEKIHTAEMEKDSSALKKLSEKFKDLSEKLI